MLDEEHMGWVRDAGSMLIAAADETGTDLVEVIATMERWIIEHTKVGDAAKVKVPPGRRGYTLRNGRMVSCPFKPAGEG